MSAALATRSISDATERVLRKRLDLVEAETRWLRDMLKSPDFYPKAFGLSGYEGRVLKALMARGVPCSRPSLLASIYFDDSADEVPEIKTVDVMICKLRRKLKRFGIEIETHWGDGYRLKDRALVTRAVEAEHAKELATAQAIMERGK